MNIRHNRIIALLLLGILACSDDGTGPGGGGGNGLSLESNRAVSKIVGPLDSTSITATGSAGASYTLTVPRLSARDTVTYSLTPIREVGGVLEDAGFVAGVRLGPDGLRLNVPATLAIQLPAGTNVNTLAGFVADDDGTDPVLVPVFVRDGRAVLLINHFSTAGVVELASNMPNPPDPDPAIDAVVKISYHILARQAAGQPLDADTLAAHMRTWYTELVRPMLASAAAGSANDSTTVAALAAEKTWTAYMVQLEQEPSMQFQLQTRLFNEMEELLPMVKNALRAAVVRNNQLCVQEDFNDAIRAINNVYYWYKHAWERSLTGAPMDRETIDQELCVVTSIDSVGFVGDVEVGANVPLQVLAGLKFDGEPGPVYSLYTHVEVVPVSGASAVAGRPLAGDTHEDGVFVTELHIETSTVVVEVRTSLNPIDVWGEEFVAYNDTTLLAQPTSVDIEPDIVTVAPGGTAQFSAAVNGTANQQVVWTTTQPGGVMSGSGLFTASATTGTFQVIASSVEEPTAQDTATVIVAAGGAPPVTGIWNTFTAVANGYFIDPTDCCMAKDDRDEKYRLEDVTFTPISATLTGTRSGSWPDRPETPDVNESGSASGDGTANGSLSFDRDSSGRIQSFDFSASASGSASSSGDGGGSGSGFGQTQTNVRFSVGGTTSVTVTIQGSCSFQSTVEGAGRAHLILFNLAGGGYRINRDCTSNGAIDYTVALAPGNYELGAGALVSLGADHPTVTSASGSASITIVVRFVP